MFILLRSKKKQNKMSKFS